MKWRYSLRWKRPGPCHGESELASEVVEAGMPAPESVMSLWVAGAGYVVCVDFLYDRPVRRWSDERKGATRRRNLARRVNRIAPLFADELIGRELAARPDYYRRKSPCRTCYSNLPGMGSAGLIKGICTDEILDIDSSV